MRYFATFAALLVVAPNPLVHSGRLKSRQLIDRTSEICEPCHEENRYDDDDVRNYRDRLRYDPYDFIDESSYHGLRESALKKLLARITINERLKSKIRARESGRATGRNRDYNVNANVFGNRIHQRSVPKGEGDLYVGEADGSIELAPRIFDNDRSKRNENSNVNVNNNVNNNTIRKKVLPQGNNQADSSDSGVSEKKSPPAISDTGLPDRVEDASSIKEEKTLPTGGATGNDAQAPTSDLNPQKKPKKSSKKKRVGGKDQDKRKRKRKQKQRRRRPKILEGERDIGNNIETTTRVSVVGEAEAKNKPEPTSQNDSANIGTTNTSESPDKTIDTNINANTNNVDGKEASSRDENLRDPKAKGFPEEFVSKPNGHENDAKTVPESHRAEVDRPDGLTVNRNKNSNVVNDRVGSELGQPKRANGTIPRGGPKLISEGKNSNVNSNANANDISVGKNSAEAKIVVENSRRSANRQIPRRLHGNGNKNVNVNSNVNTIRESGEETDQENGDEGATPKRRSADRSSSGDKNSNRNVNANFNVNRNVVGRTKPLDSRRFRPALRRGRLSALWRRRPRIRPHRVVKGASDVVEHIPIDDSAEGSDEPVEEIAHPGEEIADPGEEIAHPDEESADPGEETADHKDDDETATPMRRRLNRPSLGDKNSNRNVNVNSNVNRNVAGETKPLDSRRSRGHRHGHRRRRPKLIHHIVEGAGDVASSIEAHQDDQAEETADHEDDDETSARRRLNRPSLGETNSNRNVNTNVNVNKNVVDQTEPLDSRRARVRTRGRHRGHTRGHTRRPTPGSNPAPTPGHNFKVNPETVHHIVEGVKDIHEIYVAGQHANHGEDPDEKPSESPAESSGEDAAENPSEETDQEHDDEAATMRRTLDPSRLGNKNSNRNVNTNSNVNRNVVDRIEPLDSRRFRDRFHGFRRPHHKVHHRRFEGAGEVASHVEALFFRTTPEPAY